jgi:hypothetical protein
VRIVKRAAAKGESRGRRAVRHLRAGGGHVRMTTDQIMALTRSDR